MKNRKRLLALLLAFAMVLTYMPAMAFADTPDGTTEDVPSGTVLENDNESNPDTALEKGDSDQEPEVKDQEPQEDPVPEEVVSQGKSKATAKKALLRNAEDSESGLVVHDVITVTNKTNNTIALYGKDSGEYGFWNVVPNESKNIGLQSFDKIYANEVIKVVNPNHNFAWTADASDKAGYKYCITLASGEMAGSLSFDVESDDNYWLVTFMSNGGEGSMTPQMIPQGSETYLKAVGFTKAGCSFVGWSEDKNATEATYTDGQRVELDGDLKLYAIWKHEHKWEVTANGDTLTAKCVSADKNCEYGGAARSVKIEAEGGAYTGEAYEASIDKEMGFPSEFSVGEITYKREDTEVEEAKAVGDYTASAVVTLDGTSFNWTISTEFSITAAEIEYTAPEALNLVYSGKPQNLVSEGTVLTPGLTMEYKRSDASVWQETVPQGTSVGPYTVEYKIEGGDSYETVTGSVDVSIAPADFKAAPEAAQNLVYNGKPQSLLVSPAQKADGVEGEVYYWIGNAVENMSTSFPIATDFGTYSVSYAVFNDGIMTTETGVVEGIKIKKANAKITQRPVAKELVYDGSEQALLEDGEVSGGTLLYSLTEDGEYKETIPAGQAAGEYEVWYKVEGDDNHKDIAPTSVTAFIDKAELDMNEISLTIKGWKYGNYKKNKNGPELEGYTGSGTVTFKYVKVKEDGSIEHLKDVDPSTLAAGDYKVRAVIGETDNYYGAKTDYVAFTVLKADSKLTPPEVKTGLKYNGSAQDLITAGSSETGTMVYSLDGEHFAEAIPQGTNAGNYTISYKSIGDESHSDSEVGTVSTRINRKGISKATVTVAAEGREYTGKAQYPDSVTVTLDGKTLKEGVDYTYETTDNVNAGTAIVTVTAKGNYAESATGSFNIAKKVVGVTGVQPTNPVFTGTGLELVTPGTTTLAGVGTVYYAKGDNPEPQDYSDAIPTGVEQGTYKVTYGVVLSAEELINYEAADNESVESTISKANPDYNAPKAVTGLVYNGTEQALVSYEPKEGTAGYDVYYAFDDEDFDKHKDEPDWWTEHNLATSKPTKKEAGLYSVWYLVKGDGNHEDAGPTRILTWILPLIVTEPTGANLTYSGQPQELLTSPAETNSTDKNVKVFYKVVNGGVKTDQIPKATGDKAEATEYTIEYWAENTDLEGDAAVISEVESVTANILPVGITAPTALNPVYNGKAQALISAGDTELGKMLYKKGKNGTYTEEIPTGVTAYPYNIFYKVVNGDEVILDEVKMTAPILRADINPAVSVKGWTYGEYDPAKNYPVLSEGSNPGEGDVTYFFKSDKEDAEFVEWTEEVYPETAGTYTVKADVPETENYNGKEATNTFEVKKADIDVKVKAKEGLVYSGLAQELVTVEPSLEELAEEGVKVEFKTKLGAKFEENIPKKTDAGKYNVYYRVNGGENYNSTTWIEELLPVERVTIEQASIEPVVNIVGWTYGHYSKRVNKPSLTEESNPGKAEVTYLYAPLDPEVVDPDMEDFLDIDEDDFSVEIPEEVGHYALKAVIGETNNYYGGVAFTHFWIEKEEVNATVKIKGWTYGEYDEDINSPYVVGLPEEENFDVTYLYASEKADPEEYTDEDFSEEVPENAGSYVVKAVIESESGNYEDVEVMTPFEVEKAAINPVVLIIGWKAGEYDEKVNAPILIGNKGKADVKYYYKGVDSMGDASEDPPTEEGRYTVKAIVEESDNYLEGQSNEFEFRVYTATPEPVVAPQGKTGLVYNYDEEEEEAVVYDLLVDGTGTTTNEKGFFEYHVVTDKSWSPGTFTSWTEERPTESQAGTYYIWYRFTDKSGLTPKHETCEKPLKVTIAKHEITPQVNILGWTYAKYRSKENSPKLTAGSNPGDGEVTFEYKKADDPDTSYRKKTALQLELLDAGDYVVRATIAETDNYEGGEATADFTVEKDVASTAIAIRGELTYNGEDQSIVTLEVPIGGDVWYKVDKLDEDGDVEIVGEWSTKKPKVKDAGTYQVVYQTRGDKNHADSEILPKEPVEVVVNKAEISPELTMDGWTYGTYDARRNKPVLAEGSNPGEATPEFTYWMIDEYGDEHKVTDLASAGVGEYVVKAEIPATANYNGGNASADFTIDPAVAVVTAKDSEITYGEEAENNGYEVTGLVSGDTLTGPAEYKYVKTVLGVTIGEYEPGDLVSSVSHKYKIVVSGLENENYDIEYVDGTMTVSPRHLTVSWPSDLSFEYKGEPYTVEPTLEGFFEDDADHLQVVVEGNEATNVGEYTAEFVYMNPGLLHPSLQRCYEWSDEQASVDWEITKKTLYVTVDDQEITYGENAKPFTATIDGFVGDDDEDVLGGELEFSCSYKRFSNVGYYYITASGLDAENYDFDYEDGELTVVAAPLTFTWGETDFEYDGKYHTPEVKANTLNGDQLALTLIGDYNKKDVGEYTAEVKHSREGKGINYVVRPGEPSVKQDWSIGKTVLKVKANNKTIGYGDAPSNAGVTYSGFVGGDSVADLGGSLTYNYNYVKNGKPGNYSIVPAGLTSDKYVIRYEAGTLKVEDRETALVAQVANATNKKARLTWNSVNGATSYDIYFAKCNTPKKDNKFKKVATVKNGKLVYTKKGLKKGKTYKFYVVAKKGNTTIAKSLSIHHIAGNTQGKYTNAKSISLNTYSVTINEGQSAQLSASVKKVKSGKKLLSKGHAAVVRYISSNPQVARVNGNGTIYAEGTGYCKVYAQTVNGIWKAVEVTVK